MSQKRIVAGTEMTLEEEVEHLRSALRWALSYVPEPEESGEYTEDYGGATRMAYPDEPENWS
jgi:hypothetical protein